MSQPRSPRRWPDTLPPACEVTSTSFKNTSSPSTRVPQAHNEASGWPPAESGRARGSGLLTKSATLRQGALRTDRGADPFVTRRVIFPSLHFRVPQCNRHRGRLADRPAPGWRRRGAAVPRGSLLRGGGFSCDRTGRLTAREDHKGTELFERFTDRARRVLVLAQEEGHLLTTASSASN